MRSSASLDKDLKFAFSAFKRTKTDCAKDVALLLSMKLQIDCCLIRKNEKDSCDRVQCVFAQWIGNMLFDLQLRSLRRTTHVPKTITKALELVDDVTLMKSR